MTNLDEGIEWGVFLATYEQRPDDLSDRDYDDDRLAALRAVVDLLESARAVGKTTVPVKSIRHAILRGWYDRTSGNQTVGVTGLDGADQAVTNGR